MSTPPTFELLLGAISTLAACIAYIYRESAQRAREYADEWRGMAKETQKVLEENTRNQEQIVAAVTSIQKSEEGATSMLRDIWYEIVPTEGRGGTRNVR